MENNYIVSIVYQKNSSLKLASGMVKACSAYEAIGKAVKMKNGLGSVVLSSALDCDETKTTLFEENNSQNQ
jgi:hypothetical protein